MDTRNIADLTSAFREMLGVRFVRGDDDEVVLDMMIGPHHLNPDGVLHGGVLASLIDIACGVVIGQPLPGGMVRKAVTLSLATSFTGQAKSGLVKVIGRKRAGGRRIVFASAEVVDAYGNLLAFGEGSFRYRSTTA